jgi:hypothetical protein
MPTIPEIKAQLKELGVKGTTGKNKAELMAMLGSATDAVPKRKRPQVAPEVPKRKRPQSSVLQPPPIPAELSREAVKTLRSRLNNADIDWHSYKKRPAYSVDDIIKYIKRLQRPENWWHWDHNRTYYNLVTQYLDKLIKWVKIHSYEDEGEIEDVYGGNKRGGKEMVIAVDKWGDRFAYGGPMKLD